MRLTVRDERGHKRIAAVVAAVVLVLVGAALIAKAVNPRATSETALSPGGTPSDSEPVAKQVAVAETLGGLDADRFLSAELVPGKDTTAYDFVATMRETSLAKDSETLWEGDLALGGIAQRLVTEQDSALSDEVEGGEFSLVPDPTHSDSEGVPVGYSPLHQTYVFEAKGLTDQQIESFARKQVSGLDIDSADIRVLHPYGPALSIILHANDPRVISELTTTQEKILGPLKAHNLEGVFIEIQDDTGAPIAIQDSAERIATGRSWTDPRYDSLSTTSHG